MSNELANLMLESTITRPECGHRKIEIMPTDYCLYIYECEGCEKVIRTLAGNCCVFCSYGTVDCPPKAAGQCCS